MQKSHRPSDEQLLELITQPHFKRKADAEPPSNDPIMPTPMVVDVDQIDFYDRNPRQADNPEFENIKNDIRVGRGLDWVLNITRRPGAERNMLAAGGNSTLRAVKELWKETGDSCFQKIHCLYVPWTNDNDVLLAHLKENDQRGDLIFIDRAKAVRDLRKLIEAETGESLSQRGFAKQLQEHGYNIDQAMISRLDYAVDVLYPAIPFALKEGMGRPQVERLRNLERAFKATWEVLDLEESEIKGLFTGVLARHDCEYVDPDLVRNDLEAELMVSADCDLQHAGHLLGMALKDGLNADGVRARLNAIPERVPFPEEEEESLSTEPGSAPPPVSRVDTAGSGVSSDLSTQEPAPVPSGATGKDVGAKTPKPVVQQPNPLPHSSGANPSKDPPFDGLPNDAGLTAAQNNTQSDINDINELRGQAFGIACDLAEYIGANNIIVPIDSGYGFLVGPMPNGGRGLINEFTYEHGDRARPFTDTIWWMLAIISEQFSTHGGAIPHIPPEWSDRPIGDAMRNGARFPAWQVENLNRDATSDVPLIPTPHLGSCGFNTLSDKSWDIWIDLVSTTRKIGKLAEPWE